MAELTIEEMIAEILKENDPIGLISLELITNLKDLAYNLDDADRVIYEDRFWAAFRASIALLELDMQLQKSAPEKTGDSQYKSLLEFDMPPLEIPPERTGDSDARQLIVEDYGEEIIKQYRILVANLSEVIMNDSTEAISKDPSYDELVDPYVNHAWKIIDKIQVCLDGN